MKPALKVVLVVAVSLVIVVVLLVAFEDLAGENAKVQVTHSPTPAPTSTVPSTQTPVATETSAPSILISYWNFTGPSDFNGIIMRIVITNHGYQSFDANKAKFQVISSGKNFSYDPHWTSTYASSLYGNWTDPVLSNGETYEGGLAFNLLQPPTQTVTLVYVDTSGQYNINYIMK